MEQEKQTTNKEEKIIPASEWSGVANIVIGEHATPRCPRTDALLLDLQWMIPIRNLEKKSILSTSLKF